MRTFIAIELPKEIRDGLAKLQDKLRTSGADVKWVEPNNIHLTLKFLGEIDEQKLDKIKSILENLAKEQTQFCIRISSIGAFPRISSPRIIWVGIDKGDSETKEIVKLLEGKIGIPKEDRPFSSHITIARTRSGFNLDKLYVGLKSLENNFEMKDSQFKVTKITLFKSTLTPKGPLYETLREINFKTS